jgi:hypothetical protein
VRKGFEKVRKERTDAPSSSSGIKPSSWRKATARTENQREEMERKGWERTPCAVLEHDDRERVFLTVDVLEGGELA